MIYFLFCFEKNIRDSQNGLLDRKNKVKNQKYFSNNKFNFLLCCTSAAQAKTTITKIVQNC